MLARKKEVSISIVSLLFLVVLAVGLGCFYRLPALDSRPMHTDEAILGVKLADFWQSGTFAYDPKDYHGPALHQAASFWGRLNGWGDPSTWTEGDLRLVAVMAGLGVMLSALLFYRALGRLGTAMAMLMTAVSPAMVFYSRYFIMEMQMVLLVAVTLGCFWRYSQKGGKLWLVLGGMTLGFAHATKETFIINVAAALAGWVVARVLIGDFQPRKGNSLSLGSSSKKGGTSAPWLWVLVPAVLVSVASYSNGFKNWQAVQDSVMTFGYYFERSGGSGHEKPWHYYLTLLAWRQDGLIWSEAMLVGLGVLGMIYSLVGEFKDSARQSLLVFLSVYTLVLLGVYSLLGYKTPWCVLSAQHSLTLLAGAGAGWLWTFVGGTFGRLFYTIVVASGLWWACWQTKFATAEYRADQRNPYVYSHTTTDLLRLVKEVREVAAERGDAFSAQVINVDSGWPLPWYWSGLPKVGYQTLVPSQLSAPVIVVDAEMLPAVKNALGERAASYTESGPYGLRPNVHLTLLVQKQAAPEPQPVAPVIQPDASTPATPAPPSDAALMPPSGTLNAAPTLTPAAPVLPALPGVMPAAPSPAQPQ